MTHTTPPRVAAVVEKVGNERQDAKDNGGHSCNAELFSVHQWNGVNIHLCLCSVSGIRGKITVWQENSNFISERHIDMWADHGVEGKHRFHFRKTQLDFVENSDSFQQNISLVPMLSPCTGPGNEASKT